MTAFDLKTELVATFVEAKHLLDPQTVESLSDMVCAIRDVSDFLYTACDGPTYQKTRL